MVGLSLEGSVVPHSVAQMEVCGLHVHLQSVIATNRHTGGATCHQDGKKTDALQGIKQDFMHARAMIRSCRSCCGLIASISESLRKLSTRIAQAGAPFPEKLPSAEIQEHLGDVILETNLQATCMLW